MSASNSIEQLLSIMATLRDPEQGCPWDKKQSFDTIVPHTIEETYEVVDAIQNQDWDNLKEELGDLLFQVIFYSQMAKEQQLFDFEDVLEVLNEKLVRRHPHVFSDEKFASEQEINDNWEAEKTKEKARSGNVEKSILDSVPKSLPALSRANKIQKRCAKHGFDWDTIGPVVDKVHEEVQEVLDEALQVTVVQEKVEDELGDLLFATVNLVRHLNCNPEVALGKANNKFERRFRAVEKKVQEQGRNLDDCDLEYLDSLWDLVKQDERK
ncbi:nucleoside triphosphate pyrophosphohydrolase [Vibrio breoganii]|uniref:nucleoside triphosphate pyrophosphohydrolase n=1 Tax=Vibrio breoganii TaxID=553239 RepID=UPI00031789AA|nr:nucleoside triphosphate pyrophosphohydrolase [Vibrio breoganii]OED98302.1 nucleoside triphosphate pyrophosphohydrolase [Vibrio breoganii ZF-29]OEF81149.1 nucleoside triphosphate pyrophosphohydrolase [Vibrio breoganii 1C10]PML41583.1 nucleoside triphosphate pyrophosphohydrolase [Vibrio breoganii]PML61201.1 nucleoside triphosphate pyrophosphohydrolase [Vibrio breoganii]PMO76943.1 nucleoside triphosphate pyrophosphohydrolase [Vibrio breoganii]